MPEYAWLIAGVVLGVVGILSFRVRFDVNEWFRDRHQRDLELVKTLCPHAEPALDQSGNPSIDSFFTSPRGTFSWQCGRCGLITNDAEMVQRQIAYWAEFPDRFLEQEKKFQKHARKLGYG